MLAFLIHEIILDNKKLIKFYFSLICSVYFGLKLSLRKCPDCYDDELCLFFQNSQIQLSWFSRFLTVLNQDLTKSVFYGVFNETDVVIKRKKQRLRVNNETLNVVLCSTVKDIAFLYEKLEGVEGRKLWLDLQRSIEPLLLIYFQSQKWPFPKFLGSCGELIVEEYKGEPLANYLSSNIKRRIYLGAQLLKMAHLFTFGHPQLGFYFTDYSIYNLVVDSNGNVSLIDLDNVIISNKSVPTENNSGNKTTHNSLVLDDYKYAFSPGDVCAHSKSDHNFFSVCKYLLSHPEEGLLREIPAGFEKRHELMYLLRECAQPKTLSDRFVAGQKLLLLMEETTSDYNWHH